MPGTRHAIGKPAVERNSVEARSLDTIMRRDIAERYLHYPQRRDNEEILHGCPLRWAGLQPQQRIAAGQEFFGHRAWLRCEIPNHAAHAREQQHKADDAPNDGASGGLVADQGLVRPVLRVGDIGARAVRGRSPCRPPEERAHLPQFCRIAHGSGLYGVFIASAAEYVGVVTNQFVESLSENRVDRDPASLRIICVLPNHAPQAGLQGCLLLWSERDVVVGAGLFRPAVEDEYRFAVQPVRRPVRSDVGSVSPDGADFLTADRLPDSLAVLDRVAIKQDFPVACDNLRRNRWRTFQNLDTYTSQHRKGDSQYHR